MATIAFTPASVQLLIEGNYYCVSTQARMRYAYAYAYNVLDATHCGYYSRAALILATIRINTIPILPAKLSANCPKMSGTLLDLNLLSRVPHETHAFVPDFAIM